MLLEPNPKGGEKEELDILEGVASLVAPPSHSGLLANLGRKGTLKVPGLLLLEGGLLSRVHLRRRDQTLKEVSPCMPADSETWPWSLLASRASLPRASFSEGFPLSCKGFASFKTLDKRKL